MARSPYTYPQEVQLYCQALDFLFVASYLSHGYSELFDPPPDGIKIPRLFGASYVV
jgi:hypothetical protein